eukprot:CAMPEP_0182429886 /NCGR_PEP_ID=MMETSP1167-20130531/34702_1 /TAXON_ID=2988 /ORGANISM="Mallomonas Sp, Strain CCMP3275" /LENGTH=89 /DNA_ID=CAMNT_0024614251 /DNA_START=605 /DNA_END=874 /DNA_ORIENTATION=+
MKPVAEKRQLQAEAKEIESNGSNLNNVKTCKENSDRRRGRGNKRDKDVDDRLPKRTYEEMDVEDELAEGKYSDEDDQDGEEIDSKLAYK